MSTPQPPSADQLSAARLAHWRQNAAPEIDVPEASGAAPTGALLTIDSARQFVSACGLLLFTPRPQHIGSPAPSFVEATIGRPNPAPSLAEVGEARILLARLISEGSAVPLNLLGAPTATPDTPDFIASAATFSYIFTLRGEKAFKQLPSTTGATKVSPLALNTYNLLLENGPSTASDLATVLGKEVTEAAVLRALNELWQHLRVLPVPRPEGGATLWETVLSRFTKQLKAGANAGQPSALSALISLYLSQALLATETEIETFLSPLAPRSRVRDVLHALSGARQLETIAVEGKTHLHIHGELPIFTTTTTIDNADKTELAEPTEVALAEDGTRIRKFIPKPKKIGTGYVERAKPFPGSARTAAGARSPRTSERSSPPSRSFNKPWEEEKQQRSARSTDAEHPATPQLQDLDLDAASAPSTGRRPASGARPPRRDFGAKPPSTGDRPNFSSRPKFGGGSRPAFSRPREQGAGGRPPRRDGAAAANSGSTFAPRKPYTKPAFGDRGDRGDRKERSFAPRPPFADRGSQPFDRSSPTSDKDRRPFRREGADQTARPPRREFSGDRNDAGRPRREGFSKPAPFRARPEADGARKPERPPFRKFDAPRGPRKPFPPREGGNAQPPRRDFPGRSDFAPGAKRPFPRNAATNGPSREAGSSFGRRESGSYTGKRPGSGFAPKKPAGLKPSTFAGKGSFAGKPFASKSPGRRGVDAPGASTFDKFKGGNKPWGKRPPGRKPKPEEGES